MNIFKNILNGVKAELVRLSGDKKIFIVLVFAPVVLILLYGFEFSPHSIVGVKTMVIDKDNSSLSRKIVDAYRTSDKFDLAYYTDDENSINEYFCSEKADAAVIIPKNFMKDVLNKKGSQVLVVANGNNMIIGNSVLMGSLEIIQTYSVGTSMKLLGAQGITPETAKDIAMPIEFGTRIWYNPTFNYSAYLTIGLLVLIIQQVCMLFVANSFVINKQTIGPRLISLREAFYKIIGIVIVHFSINYINLLLGIEVLIKIFRIPFRGNLFNLMWFAAIFLLVVISYAILLSIICRKDVEATQYSIFFAVPSFLLSGYTWPRFMMMPPIKIISNILPVTYFAEPMRKMFLMGADISYFKYQVIVLSCIAIVFLPLALFLYFLKASYFSKKFNIPFGEEKMISG